MECIFEVLSFWRLDQPNMITRSFYRLSLIRKLVNKLIIIKITCIIDCELELKIIFLLYPIDVGTSPNALIKYFIKKYFFNSQ